MSLVLLDPHVHIYPNFNLGLFFESAFSNFFKSAKELGNIDLFAIILTEKNEHNYYTQLSDILDPEEYKIDNHGSYQLIRHQNFQPLIVFPGRQVNSHEKLELLGLFVYSSLPEKLGLTETISEIHSQGGISVINWAPGKWWGKRGRLLGNMLPQLPKNVLLGYTCLLPEIFSLPALILRRLSAGGNAICGSDPLPQNGEESLVGSTGIIVEIKNIDPVNEIKEFLDKQEKIATFGKRNSLIRSLTRIVSFELNRRFRSN